MSRNIFSWFGLIVLGICVCAVAADAGTMKKKKERKLVETQRLVYKVSMTDREIGSETITRHTYNDNTVEFVVDMVDQFTAETRQKQHVTLLVEEESYFPRSFRSKKEISTSGREIVHEVAIDMFSNVAVVDTHLGATTDTRNFVLPTGTAFFEVGALYPLHQLLYWYARDIGGFQSFYIFDFQRGKELTAVLSMSGPETVDTINGNVETDVIEFENDEYKMRMNVTKDGLVVRADQSTTRFELVEMSTE